MGRKVPREIPMQDSEKSDFLMPSHLRLSFGIVLKAEKGSLIVSTLPLSLFLFATRSHLFWFLSLSASRHSFLSTSSFAVSSSYFNWKFPIDHIFFPWNLNLADLRGTRWCTFSWNYHKTPIRRYFHILEKGSHGVVEERNNLNIPLCSSDPSRCLILHWEINSVLHGISRTAYCTNRPHPT